MLSSYITCVAISIAFLYGVQILELQKRLDIARQQIRQLPGINYNKEEQLQRLETLRNQLVLKQKLIKKYKHAQF